MTVFDLSPQARVLVRATVIEPYAEHCLIGIPMARSTANGHHRIHVDFSEIVLRDFQIAYEVSRLVRDTLRLVREQHQGLGDGLRLLDDRILRLDAEMYETGSSPLFPLIKR